MPKILFLGDIVAKGGRTIVRDKLPELINKHAPDVVIANAENAAGGFGIDLKCCDEIFASGVQIITSGNHIWKKKEIIKYLENKPEKIIRPGNFPPGTPGNGYLIHHLPGGETLGVVNLMGRIFLGELLDCPFRKADELLLNELSNCTYTFFDFHAEATSEKVAFGLHLDGRASAVVGTHTHVQTADERALPEGTLYITDVGMCGPLNGVIGMEKDAIINKFISGMPTNFNALTKGTMCICGVIIELDKEKSSINRIFEIA